MEKQFRFLIFSSCNERHYIQFKNILFLKKSLIQKYILVACFCKLLIIIYILVFKNWNGFLTNKTLFFYLYKIVLISRFFVKHFSFVCKFSFLIVGQCYLPINKVNLKKWKIQLIHHHDKTSTECSSDNIKFSIYIIIAKIFISDIGSWLYVQ